MSAPRGRRRLVVALAISVGLAATLIGLERPSHGLGEGTLTAQPVLGVPALTMLGASPGEAAGEVWGMVPETANLQRYTTAGGWEAQPSPTGEATGVKFAAGALAGRTTAAGGVAIAAQAEEGGSAVQTLVLRDPGGAPRVLPAPVPGGPVLEEGEGLFGKVPELVPIEEAGGGTGVLLSPTSKEAPTAILHYDGNGWSREPICSEPAPAPCEAPGPGFSVLAIDAASPADAWLLAEDKGSGLGEGTPAEGEPEKPTEPAEGEPKEPGEPAEGEEPEPEEEPSGLVLLTREGTGPGANWRPRKLGAPGTLGGYYGQSMPAVGAPGAVKVAPRALGQPLVVAAEGVWADATLTPAAGKPIDATVFYSLAAGAVTASWCDPPPELAPLCTHPLGSELPAGESRSFAWPGSGPFGQRVITGVGQGAILSLAGEAWGRIATVGGDTGAERGAAFTAPDDGWLGSSSGLIRLSRTPESSGLTPWPIPFRRPLTAVVPAPGQAPGALGSEALAVGIEGEAARYRPGEGWQPEYMLGGSGTRATPSLRAVAWPEAGRAFAVGDGSQMWVWRKATGLWEADPAKPPNLDRANFTGIAFDPADPARGYAVGKQGVLLSYGRSWQAEALPAGVNPEANLTSVAFAGSQAIVAFRYPSEDGFDETGLLLNDGNGWRVEPSSAFPGRLGDPEAVAGLPDGGAVVASSRGVFERESATAPWVATPPPPAEVVAIAPYRESGLLRAMISVEVPVAGVPDSKHTRDANIDLEQIRNPSPPGSPPLLTDPYVLPNSGFVLRQTQTGWRDEEHEALPRPTNGEAVSDAPRRPDPVLAMLMAPDGSEGWALGGETGATARFENIAKAIQTAGVLRFPAGGTPPTGAGLAPVPPNAGAATFAVAGGAQCVAACADLAGAGIGPDVWLPAAAQTASGVAGLRGFLYTGSGVAEGLGASLTPSAYARESAAYSRRLAAGAGALPTFAAPAASDLDGNGSLDTFRAAFAGFAAPLGSGAGNGVTPISPTGPGKAYYSFVSSGAEGDVAVVVLDYSRPQLGREQQCWLSGQLQAAAAIGAPAIVVGNRALGPVTGSPNVAADSETVSATVVTGETPECPLGAGVGASAYFFEYPEGNRSFPLTAGGRSIPEVGSGTLGYVEPPPVAGQGSAGASGFVLAAVDVAHRDPVTNVAPVGVRLVPSIRALAIDATDGTLLRRSQPALFEALARRPRAGLKCSLSSGCVAPDPYVQIPAICRGATCGTTLEPEYSFTSSSPDVADFVAPDPNSTNPRRVLLNSAGETTPSSTSGLLCAFNAGTTTVTVVTGGLSYSVPVTVQPGSVQRPCGTVPLRNPPPQTAAEVNEVPPLPEAEPEPGPRDQRPPVHLPPGPTLAQQPSVQSTPPQPVPPPAVLPQQHPRPTPPPIPVPTPSVYRVPTIVPPPPPPVGRPAPPSGTSPVEVSSPVAQSAVSPEDEEQPEVETSEVHHMSRYEPDRFDLPPAVPIVALIAAAIGVTGIRAARRRPAYVRLERRSSK